MSKILQSAKSLLHHDKHDKITTKLRRRSESAEERKKLTATEREKAEREERDESGSRMSSDICVPQLGHSGGYAHEVLVTPSSPFEVSPFGAGAGAGAAADACAGTGAHTAYWASDVH
jgi:hypothetical protein